jgi:hypothetical protein
MGGGEGDGVRDDDGDASMSACVGPILKYDSFRSDAVPLTSLSLPPSSQPSSSSLSEHSVNELMIDDSAGSGDIGGDGGGDVGSRCSWLAVWRWRRSNQLRLLLLLVVIAAIVTAVVVFHLEDRFVDMLKWMQSNQKEGALIFISVYVVATVMMLPASVLSLGAGYVFRPLPLAIAIVLVGAGIGRRRTTFICIAVRVIICLLTADHYRFNLVCALAHLLSDQSFRNCVI